MELLQEAAQLDGRRQNTNLRKLWIGLPLAGFSRSRRTITKLNEPRRLALVLAHALRLHVQMLIPSPREPRWSPERPTPWDVQRNEKEAAVEYGTLGVSS